MAFMCLPPLQCTYDGPHSFSPATPPSFPLLQRYSHQKAHRPKTKNYRITQRKPEITPTKTLDPATCAYVSKAGYHISADKESKTKQCKFFATCSPGLEQVVAAELTSALIGATEVEVGSAGVYFHGTISTGYRANLWLRCAVRVLIELGSAEISKKNRDSVYNFVRNAVNWPQYLALDTVTKTGWKQWQFRSFAVQSRVWDCTQVTNSMSASVRAKDAICDSLREACNNTKPDPPEEGGAMADVPLFLSLYKDNAILYRDMSGISLHRRGYRSAMHRASLNEAVAAGILTFAGWNRRVQGFGVVNQNAGFRSLENMVLLDPMCGSGTFLIEAALIAANRAPGLMRNTWPFESWHDFDLESWRECCLNATSAEATLPHGCKILGNDIHEGALSLCARDAEAAGVKHAIELSCKDCRDYAPPVAPSLVVVNPPWGFRLGSAGEKGNEGVESAWKELGQLLKQHCRCADVYILSGNPTLTRALHMKADKKWPITIGGVECRLLHYYVLPPRVTTVSNPGQGGEKQSITEAFAP